MGIPKRELESAHQRRRDLHGSAVARPCTDTLSRGFAAAPSSQFSLPAAPPSLVKARSNLEWQERGSGYRDPGTSGLSPSWSENQRGAWASVATGLTRMRPAWAHQGAATELPDLTVVL